MSGLGIYGFDPTDCFLFWLHVSIEKCLHVKTP